MKRIVFLNLALLLVSTAFGQIAITEDTLQDLLDKRRTEVAYLATDLSAATALKAMTGTDLTWDITGIPFEVRDTEIIDLLSSTAGTIGENEPVFSSSNMVLTFLDSDDGVEFQNESHYSLTSTEFALLGTIGVGEFFQSGVVDTLTLQNTPPDVQLTFPFTFGTTISDSVTMSIFAADTLFTTNSAAKDGEVDGWGTLVSPWGSIDVLRYRVEERRYEMGIFDETEVLIEWWGPLGPVMDMELDGAGNVVDLTYFDISIGKTYPVSSAESTHHLTAGPDTLATVSFVEVGNVTELTIQSYSQSAPAGLHPALPRYYDINANGDNFEADVSLRYTDEDVLVSGLTEGNLQLYQLLSGRWTVAGGVVNPDLNTVSLSGVNAFSQWAFGDPAVTVDIDSPEPDGMPGLRYNYPNPFSESTTIRFSTPTVSHVRAAVYDIMGREIAILVDDILLAGDHDVVFSARGLSSGVYFVRLTAEGSSEVRSVTLVR